MRVSPNALLLFAAICALSAPAQAQQGVSDLAAPRPSDAPRAHDSSSVSALAAPHHAASVDAEASETSEVPDPDADVAPSAGGPRIELGYALYSLSDGESSGRVHAGSFGGYFHTGALRLGARAELGKRANRFGVDDVVVRAVGVAGYQRRLTRWVPYLVAVASYGWLIEQGTGSPRSAGLPGGGLELGVDLRLGAVFFGLSAGWSRLWLRGDSQDLWLLRFRAGV